MINHGITAENLLRTLPGVLANDEKMLALASVVADILSARTNEIDELKIYPQINHVPEALLDILADDFKIDWYGYNYPLAVKQSQFRSSFKVRRYLGTKGATETALNDLYPGTILEEWYEYGGSPHYFRVLLDVTHQNIPVSHPDIVRTIEIFKNQRSLLEDNSVVFRSRGQIAIGTSSRYFLYDVRLCGTYPARATQGIIDPDNIVIVTDDFNAVYAVPLSGEINAGLYPVTAVQGDIEGSGVGIGTDGDGVAYSARFCGTAPDSLI